MNVTKLFFFKSLRYCHERFYASWIVLNKTTKMPQKSKKYGYFANI